MAPSAGLGVQDTYVAIVRDLVYTWSFKGSPRLMVEILHDPICTLLPEALPCYIIGIIDIMSLLCDPVEARKLEYDRPLIPKPKKEGTPAEITLHPYSNFLESTVGVVKDYADA